MAKSLQVSDGALELLKWLGLLLMTADHVNKYLFEGQKQAYFAAGRSCVPLFCFVLAYNLSRKGIVESGVISRVIKRTAITGTISTPFFMALGNVYFGWWPLNIMFSLSASAILVLLISNGGTANNRKAIAIFIIAGILVEYLWYAMTLFLAWWHYCRNPKIPSYFLVCVATASLYFVNMNMWAMAALPVIATVQYINIRIPRRKMLFYGYYPVHLAALLLIKLAVIT